MRNSKVVMSIALICLSGCHASGSDGASSSNTASDPMSAPVADAMAETPVADAMAEAPVADAMAEAPVADAMAKAPAADAMASAAPTTPTNKTGPTTGDIIGGIVIATGLAWLYSQLTKKDNSQASQEYPSQQELNRQQRERCEQNFYSIDPNSDNGQRQRCLEKYPY